MKREEQKFTGVLKDKELYLIEQGLEELNTDEAQKVIMKLYKEFWEK